MVVPAVGAPVGDRRRPSDAAAAVSAPAQPVHLLARHQRHLVGPGLPHLPGALHRALRRGYASGYAPCSTRSRSSSRSSSSRPSQRSPTTRSRAGDGASHTSSSERCSTSSFCSASRRRTSSSSILVFMILLQCSSNFAQGPFQGYVPDLVPEKQVGTASGLMGVMIVLGQVVGVGIATLGLHPDGRHQAALRHCRGRRAGAPGLLLADAGPGAPRVRDDDSDHPVRQRGPARARSRGAIVDEHRARRVGHGHPARAQLRVAARVAACSS